MLSESHHSVTYALLTTLELNKKLDSLPILFLSVPEYNNTIQYPEARILIVQALSTFTRP